MKQIFILGVGRNTPVIMELAELNGYIIKGLYHYERGREGEMIHGIPIIGCNEDLFKQQDLQDLNFALSMGDNTVRVRIGNKIREKGGKVPTLIHPRTFISQYAKIEEGVVIHANTTIQPDVVIGSDSYISFNVGIAHNTIIEKGCYIAAQTIIGAYTHIFEKAFVGQGAIIISGKAHSIGKNAIIGAGAVVINSVEDSQTVIGNPAKPLSK